MLATKAALKARELLSGALELLQRATVRRPGLEPALDAAAAASSALFELGDASISQAGAQGRLRFAAERLGASLALLQGEAAKHDELAPAIESAARALAVIYPLAAVPRQRRDVVAPLSVPPKGPGLANLPRAPEPLMTPRSALGSYAGEDRRTGRGRVPVETDIGLLSDSHFYVGLSQDLSQGGVFVATYEPRRPGTRVTLCFVLPDGHAVEAGGVVRWVREASEAAPPGMGVAFQEIAKEDVQAIARFCTQREPIYYETGDD